MKVVKFLTGVLALALVCSYTISLSSCTGEGQPVKITVPGMGNPTPTAANPVERADTGESQSEGESSQEEQQGDTPSGNGLVEVNGKSYYYDSEGNVQKNGIVGSDVDGWYYANADGVIDMGYCDGVSFNGSDWNVIEGKAKKVDGESDTTLFYALQAIAKCTNSSMTREEKLRSSFDYIKTAYLEGVRHDPPYTEIDWPILYANDIYVYGKGDCFSYGAAYAYMARAIGYDEVYACNSGGHGWAEVEGKYYDPEWDMHHNEYNHFGVAPTDPCDVDYSGGLMDGVDWMRVKIK